MNRKTFKPGDCVVFCRMKHKTHPSRRACAVQPAANGDDYSYYVKKFWVVCDVLSDGRVMLQTPRGRRHLVRADDPGLSHASLLEKFWYRNRFLQSQSAVAAV